MKDSAPLRLAIIAAAGLIVVVVSFAVRSRVRSTIAPASTPPAVSKLDAPRETPKAPEVPAQPTAIRGAVFDGTTGKPLAGAKLCFYPPRPRRPDENLRKSFIANYRTAGGGIGAIGMYVKYNEADLVFDRPADDAMPVAEAESGESGAYSLDAPFLEGIIECRHPGYLTAFGPHLSFHKDRPFDIRLHLGVLIRGRVVRSDGEAVKEKLRIAVFGQDHKNWIGGGLWRTETDGLGAFQVEVGAPKIIPKIENLGWRTDKPDAPVDVVPGMTLEVVARRAPVLRVIDAVTRAPIERFSMLLSKPGTSGGWMRGQFDAPGGVLELLYDTIDDKSYQGPFKIQVWTDGMAPFETDVADLLTSEDIVAEMVRGEPPAVTGVVRRKGEALEGADVSLNSGFQMTGNWKPERLSSVAAVKSAENGSFTLKAPAGPYMLMVKSGSVTHAIPVHAPSQGLVVDLADLADVEVRVRDAEGKALGQIVVLLQLSESARRWHASSDSGGVARFTAIAPGEAWIAPGKIYYPGANEYTNHVSPWKKVQLAAGQTNSIDLTVEVPAESKPLTARLSLKGVSDPELWTVRNLASRGQEDPISVGADGQFVVPSRDWGFAVVSPDGDHWYFSSRKVAGDSWDITVDLDGPGYDGVLKDASTGRPIAGAKVSATARNSNVWRVSTTTDGEGRFRLRGLGPEAHEFSFSKEGLYGVSFETTLAAAVDPPRFNLSIPMTRDGMAFPGYETRRLSGRLLESATGRPPVDSRVAILAIVPVPQGQLILTHAQCSVGVAGDGTFSVSAPAAARYRAQMSISIGRPDSRHHQQEWNAADQTQGPLELRLP